LLVSHHAYVYDAVLVLPAVAMALRLKASQALRYAALALCVPIPYLLLMKEHGVWMAAQIGINGFGLMLLGLLALHGLRPRLLDSKHKRLAMFQPQVSDSGRA